MAAKSAEYYNSQEAPDCVQSDRRLWWMNEKAEERRVCECAVICVLGMHYIFTPSLFS